MNNKKKLDNPVTLFAAIEKKQYEAIRKIAFKEKRSIASIAREAIDMFIKSKRKQ